MIEVRPCDGEERLLAMQSEMSDASNRIFRQLNDADLKFGMVKDESGDEIDQGIIKQVRVYVAAKKKLRATRAMKVPPAQAQKLFVVASSLKPRSPEPWANLGWCALDLGRYDDPIMFDPEPVQSADYLVMESTYGDRVRERTDPAGTLADVIGATVDRGGTVVVPAFAVGRAQTLLYYLWQLRSAGRLPDIPVYLDSPMAINASELLGTHRADHRLTPEVYEGMCAMAAYTREADESRKISESSEPKVVISASGMATGGRILHHLKAFAPDPRNTIIITGYQVPGTRGRSIAAGERQVRIYGEWIPINAQVANLQMLSAHADADELIRWAAGFTTAPRQVFVVHGEPQPADTLRSRLGREFGWQATVPRPGQVFGL